MLDRVGLTNDSIWTATAETPSFPPLREDCMAEVCVVGAGIAGLTIAYELGRAGKQVVLLDKGRVGAGMTSMTTAHLVSAVDDRYFELERLHGREVARLVADGHCAAIDRIDAIVQHERIACGFSRLDGYLTLAANDEIATLERELEAVHNAGLLQVELIQHVCYPARGAEACLRFPRQGRFHPLHYVNGLAAAITSAGGRLFCDTPVDDVMGGSPVAVRAGAFTVRADAVVIATNSPITERIAIHTKQAPYMTYVIAAPVPNASVPDALVWDTADPYHYVRLQRVDGAPGEASRDYVIVGGEDHKTGQASNADERFARIDEWARERYLTMGEVEYAWAGEIMESVDRLAFIGPSPSADEGVYIVTGESGAGMTHSTIAASIISDALLGRDNPWAAVYEPSRRTYSAAKTYLKENLNVAAQYVDWITPGDVASTDDIALDSGAIVRRGFTKLAVYRDEHGELHERSAVCPHLGCIVRWNASERTWDCPCHGSRFEKLGRVLSGPANRDLGPGAPQ